jgi:hypothetical protein
MSTNLAKYIKQERVKQGLNYAELSRLMGYKNLNRGMRRIIDELENKHEDEGYKEMISRYSEYFIIEGFEINIEAVLKPEDTLPLVSINPPT